MIRINVVLPAPFGPSRPYIPQFSAKLVRSRATVSPYSLLTFSSTSAITLRAPSQFYARALRLHSRQDAPNSNPLSKMTSATGFQMSFH